jgi:Ca2+-transporting ATPase
MERRPRKPGQPILNRADTRWFIVAGLTMAAATMAVIAGAEHEEGKELARTMGMTTFAIANLCFSFTARDKLRSVFSLDTFNDRTFLMTSLLSAGAIIFATELQFFQRILDTVELTGNQWLICLAGGLLVVSVSEVWKLVLRRESSGRGDDASPA